MSDIQTACAVITLVATSVNFLFVMLILRDLQEAKQIRCRSTAGEQQ